MKLDLSDEGIRQMARAVAPLLDPADRHLLEPRLRPEHREIDAAIEQLGWIEPDVAADHAVAILIDATHPGRCIEPTDDQGDVAWCSSMLCRLVDPWVGSRAARRWFVHLHRLRAADIEVSSLVESIAAWGVVAFEQLLGRPHEVGRWARTAALMTEGDERPGHNLLAVVRGVRLLEPVLRRWPSSP